MAQYKKCSTCRGNGFTHGLGFVRVDCYECNGRGRVRADEPESAQEAETSEKPKKAKIDKRSAAYKEAIKKIKGDSDMSDKDAEKIFADEMDRIETQEAA